MFHVGDLVETLEGQTPLKPGLYQILTVSAGSARLSRLRGEMEDDLDACLNHITFVPAAVLERFHLVGMIFD
ncbi:MAG: hypothetical protein JWN14_4140 [Chthonomonadales bacterium]|nr:hypothetical protein [Chthonomonadales bacterium]